MNFIALKVKINDNWEYLDLNSDLSFTKSNELYLFSEVEYSRSVSIKIPSTEHNLEIFNNPDLPIGNGYYMTVKLPCLITLENTDFHGLLLVNKSAEHSLTGTIIIDSCSVLDYINNKQISEIGLPDSQYSVQWLASNLTYANDNSLINKKIAIIPYLNNAIQGWYHNGQPDAISHAEIFYKLGCWYPSIKVAELIKDILYKAKNDTGTNIDLTHLYDDVPDGLVHGTWMIVDKNVKTDSVSATFAKSDNTTITSGTGTYPGGLEITERTAKVYTGEVNFWGDARTYNVSEFKFNKDTDLFFSGIPSNANIIIGYTYGVWGTKNLKTGKLMMTSSDLITINSGDLIHIPAGESFSFYRKDMARVSDFHFTSGRIYFANPEGYGGEWGNGTWSLSSSLQVDPEGEENTLIPGDTWKMSDNPLDINIMDLIKSFAYTTGTQFVYEPADNKDPDRGQLKFVHTSIHSTKEIHDITKIDSLEKKVGSFSKTETIKFADGDYVEATGTAPITRVYEIGNDQLDSHNEREIPLDSGALLFLNRWHYVAPGAGGYIYGQKTWFFRDDINIDLEEDDEIGDVEINYDPPGITIARALPYMNGVGLDYRFLQRLDQRAIGGIPEDPFYTDIFTNATRYCIQFPLELQEYFDLSGYTDFWISGVRYAWFKMQWSKGICKGEFQKYTDYLTHNYTIETIADPTMAGITSGGGTYQEGTLITISVIPQFGCILDYWEDEEGNVISHDLSFQWTVEGPKTFTAHFIVPKYYVDLTSAPDGSYGSLSGEGYYDALSTCTVSAHPNPGYYFVGWYQNNQLLTTNSVYSFTVVSNTSLVGQFEQYPNYHITLGVEGVASGIEVGLSGAGYYQGGTTASVSVSINELQRESSYTFLGWYEDNQQVSISNPYSFVVDRDRHLVAKFQHKVKITISSKNPYGIEGTWTGDGYYNQGDTAILQAFPNSGLQFSDWLDLDNNTVYSTSNPLIINNIQNDLNLYIEWDSIETDIYVNILPRTGGTTTGQGPYAIGSTVRIEATPNTGYTFVKWVDELGMEIISNPYTFTASVNKTFTPVYNQTTYTITGIARPNNAGYVEGNGTTFHYNDLCVLTAIPYTRGYSFVNWTDENDNIVSTSTPYYFNVSQDLTLYANFTSDATYYNVSCRVRPSGFGTVSGFGSYEAGSICTLRATPNSSYIFLGYYDTNDNLVSSNPVYSFTVNSNVSLVAKFDKAAPSQYTITLNTNIDDGNTVQFGIPGQQYTITLEKNIEEGGSVNFDSPTSD